MSSALPPQARPFSTAQWTAIAFVWWLLFMGSLTPGNVQHGLDAGMTPDWALEAVRLAAAAILGASVTPLLLALARRFPLEGAGAWRNAAVQLAAAAGLSPALILMSCLLAAWAFDGRLLPTRAELAGQLMANSLLLMFCLSLLLAVIQILPRLSDPRRAAAWPQRLTLGERGRLTVVDLAAVEWVETQGNYQALHTADGVHLLRETSKGLAARLDPERFVRIHRRFIVAADRVREIEPMPNGDAVVRLASGVELRQSRQHRHALRARLRR